MNSATPKRKLKNKAQIQNDLKRGGAEKKRAEKRQLKLEDDKVKEDEMWNRLNKLNGEFKKIKQANKDNKKMLSTILSNFNFFQYLIVKLVSILNVSCQKMSDSGFFLLSTNKLYKKENTKMLKNFPAGYVGSFYRNLADNIDTTSDFYSRIAADADIPKEDVQKYILATSDFAKSIQTDINHYVTRDRINNASFRQRLDPISNNILRRQNRLELVFEDISTFDAENPIAGSLLREIDIKKKAI